MLNRILTFYNKYFVVWVLLFGLIAYFIPKPFMLMKDWNQQFFALTMFGIGAVLEIDDFKRIVQKPVIILIGSLAQFIVMPLGAFALARIFDLPPYLATGLILAGCVPGAMASNVMSYLAKADTAYSISLTTVSTLLCPILTPALTKLLAGETLEVSFMKMFWMIIRIVTVPLIIGFLTRHMLKDRIKKIEAVFPAISVTFIVLICAFVIAGNRERLREVTILILAVATVLNLYGMTAGYGIGLFSRMSLPRRRTLCIEIGMQNAGLGTVLAVNNFKESLTAVPTAIYVFICIITASVISEYWARGKQSLD